MQQPIIFKHKNKSNTHIQMFSNTSYNQHTIMINKTNRIMYNY